MRGEAIFRARLEGWRHSEVVVCWGRDYLIQELEDLDRFYVVVQQTEDQLLPMTAAWCRVEANRQGVDEDVVLGLLKTRLAPIDLEDGRGGLYAGPRVSPNLRRHLVAHTTRILREQGYRGQISEAQEA